MLVLTRASGLGEDLEAKVRAQLGGVICDMPAYASSILPRGRRVDFVRRVPARVCESLLEIHLSGLRAARTRRKSNGTHWIDDRQRLKFWMSMEDGV